MSSSEKAPFKANREKQNSLKQMDEKNEGADPIKYDFVEKKRFQ